MCGCCVAHLGLFLFLPISSGGASPFSKRRFYDKSDGSGGGSGKAVSLARLLLLLAVLVLLAVAVVAVIAVVKAYDNADRLDVLQASNARLRADTDAIRGSLPIKFTLTQQLATDGTRDAEVFDMDGSKFLVMANSRNSDGSSKDVDSTVYQWSDATAGFELVQKLPTANAHDSEAFTVDGGHYLVVACRNSAATNVWKWNAGTGQFQVHQVCSVVQGGAWGCMRNPVVCRVCVHRNLACTQPVTLTFSRCRATNTSWAWLCPSPLTPAALCATPPTAFCTSGTGVRQPACCGLLSFTSFASLTPAGRRVQCHTVV